MAIAHKYSRILKIIFDLITHVLYVWHAIGMQGIFVKLFGESGSEICENI